VLNINKVCMTQASRTGHVETRIIIETGRYAVGKAVSMLQR